MILNGHIKLIKLAFGPGVIDVTFISNAKKNLIGNNVSFFEYYESYSIKLYLIK